MQGGSTAPTAIAYRTTELHIPLGCENLRLMLNHRHCGSSGVGSRSVGEDCEEDKEKYASSCVHGHIPTT